MHFFKKNNLLLPYILSRNNLKVGYLNLKVSRTNQKTIYIKRNTENGDLEEFFPSVEEI